MCSDAVVEDKCNVCREEGERRLFSNALSRDDGLLGAHQVHRGHAPPPSAPQMRVRGARGIVLTGFSSGSKETSDAFVRSAVVLVKGKVPF